MVIDKIQLIGGWIAKSFRHGTSGRIAIVDILEHDETDRARRRFFKCPDLDLDFVVQ
jgi:hypothetical protein